MHQIFTARFYKLFTVLLVSSSVFLAGCGKKTPAGPVSLSSKSYFVRGGWHHPQSYYEYCQTGLASWYGDDFHGKKKASGEIFNKMDMTAAHKTLPIPCVAKVTNLRTGKSVVVVVDDRGPFVYKGRIIDLSYGAAKALDLHRYKPSPVKVEVLVRDSCALSCYISKHCKKLRDQKGRSWSQLYYQEIANKKMPVSIAQDFEQAPPHRCKSATDKPAKAMKQENVKQTAQSGAKRKNFKYVTHHHGS